MHKISPLYYRLFSLLLNVILIFFAMLCFGYSPAYADQAKLSWCKNHWPDLKYYSIYYKLPESTSYMATNVTSDLLQDDTSRSDCIDTTAVMYSMDLPVGVYNFKMTLSNTLGFESGFSGELTKIVADPIRDTDNDGVSDRDELSGGMDPNNPTDNIPDISCGVDKTVYPGWQQIGCTTSDPNGDVLTHTWTVVSLPVGVNEASLGMSAYDGSNLKLLALKTGDYIVRLDVSDNKVVVSKEVKIYVSDIAPKAIAGTKQVVEVGSPVQLSGSAEDPNADDISYEWSMVKGSASVSLSAYDIFNPSFTPTVPGIYIFELFARDTTLRNPPDVTQRDNVTIVIHTVPIANAGKDRDVILNTIVGLNGTKSHASEGVGGKPAGYLWSLISYPERLSVEAAASLLSDPSSPEPEFIPPVVGIYSFSLVTSNGGYNSSSDFVHITVQEPPYIIPVANAGSDSEGLTGEKITLGGGKSTSYNNAPLTYTWEQTKDGGTPVELKGKNSMIFTFIPTFSGTYIFTLTVNDNVSNSLPNTVMVTVHNSNMVPVANAGKDIINGQVGEKITLDGSLSSDENGDLLSYNWQQLEGSDVSLSLYTDQTPYFIPAFPGNYTFELRVKDSESTSSPSLVNILVGSAGVAVAGEDRAVDLGVEVALDAVESYDPDCVEDSASKQCNELSFEWKKVSGPVALLNDIDTAVARFTPEQEGIYRFRLDIYDNVSEGLPDFVNIHAFRKVYETMFIAADEDTIISTDIDYAIVEAVIPAGVLPAGSLVTVGLSNITSPFGDNGEVMVIGPINEELKSSVNMKLIFTELIGDIEIMSYDSSRKIWEAVTIIEQSDNYVVVQLNRLTRLAVNMVSRVDKQDTKETTQPEKKKRSGGGGCGFIKPSSSDGSGGGGGGASLFMMLSLVALLPALRRLVNIQDRQSI